MHEALSEPFLSQLSELLTARLGIHFPRDRWNDLGRAIDAAAVDLGFKAGGPFVQWLLSSPLQRRELEILAAHLTVGETYFFREPQIYEALETRILPDLIRSRRGRNQSLRIWSAGCATGEEPYSIAILLHNLIPDFSDWNITILATDINPRFLQKAAEGIYTEWSFRGVPAWVKQTCFKSRPKGRWEILPCVRRMVTLMYLNLAEDVYPALANGTNAMDLIFCRNVLMYFSPPRAKRVIENLRHCLVDGGWLAVSSAEASHTLFAAFESLNIRGATFYRKSDEYVKRVREANVLYWEIGKPALPVEPLEPLTDVPEVARPVSDDIVLPPAVHEAAPPAAEVEPDPYRDACALFRQGNYGAAADNLAAMLSADPQNTRAMELLARALANQGRLAEACEWCERAIKSDKLNAGCHYLLATVQQERGQPADAVASLKRAIYLDPKFVLAHFAMGNLATLQGETGKADRHFANALAFLGDYQPEDMLPESEGMTAGRLREIIEAVMFAREAA
jgi:chemotaxis protein methyltransferase CheR